jgi:hypothetical protein
MVQTAYLGSTAFSNITVGSTTVSAVYVGSTKIWEAGSSWTNPDLSSASYDSVSFDLTTQDSLPFEIRFNNDGTKMYMVGNSNDSVYEYTLSTAYDVSTASYNSASLSVTSQETVPVGLFFKPDGTKMYINGLVNDAIFQYSLSTAWDLSTASYDSVSFSVSSQDGIPYTSFFKPDGTKFYVIGLDTDNVFQYSLSTAWNLSSASYDSVSFNVTTQTTTPCSVVFNPNGDKMYISDFSADDVFQYSLSTAWDVSSASYDSVSFDASTQVSNATSLEFKPDGSKMYITDNMNGIVYQYST